jgi:prolipoprotein diacylglyceryltransferase
VEYRQYAGSFIYQQPDCADRLKMGDVFLTYLVIYPLGRFLLEFLRLDPSPVANININQTIMLVIMIVQLLPYSCVTGLGRAEQSSKPED